jgi:hypothetical protein
MPRRLVGYTLAGIGIAWGLVALSVVLTLGAYAGYTVYLIVSYWSVGAPHSGRCGCGG